MKILIILVLVIGLGLSGCANNPASWDDSERLSNTVLSETIISKMQQNISERTFEDFTDESTSDAKMKFEDFTNESTFGDCLAKINKESIRNASIAYETELLGYPAVAQCSFKKHGNEILADGFSFNVMSVSDAVVEEILGKLDAELGSRKTDPFADYEWEKDGLKVGLSHFREYDGQMHIWMNTPRASGGSFPNAPSIFPCQLGADIDTVYNGITMAPPSGPSMCGESFLDYRDGGFDISLRFETDEAGAIRLTWGTYYINNDDMSFEDSVEYYDSFADSLQDIIGSVPVSRGFGIQYTTDDGWTIYEVGSDSSNQLMSAQEILDSGTDCYSFQAEWPGIIYSAVYNEYECYSNLDIFYLRESFTDEEIE